MTLAMLVVQFFLFFFLGHFVVDALWKIRNGEPGGGLAAFMAVGTVVSIAMLYIQASAM